MFRRRQAIAVEPQPDGLPKKGLFAEPVRVAMIKILEPEAVDDDKRVTFLVEVRDANGQRCPDFAVEALVHGPHRQRTVQGNTDMLGRVRFRMTGPSGRYQVSVTDVGAGGMQWDRSASELHASITV